MIREDYVMRLIRQLVEAIARIAGYRKRGDFDRAMTEVGRAWDDLGVPRELVTATDVDTLAGLLREPDKLRVAAALLAEEAHVMHAKGDPMNASVLRRRAIELYVRAREADPRAADDDEISGLAQFLSPAELADAVRPSHRA